MRNKKYIFYIFIISVLLSVVVTVFLYPKVKKYDTGFISKEIIDISKEISGDFNSDGIDDRVILKYSDYDAISLSTGQAKNQINLQDKFLNKEFLIGNYNNDKFQELTFLTKNNDSVFFNLAELGQRINSW